MAESLEAGGKDVPVSCRRYMSGMMIERSYHETLSIAGGIDKTKERGGFARVLYRR